MVDPYKKLTGIALLWHRIKMQWRRWFPRPAGLYEFLKNGDVLRYDPAPISGVTDFTEAFRKTLREPDIYKVVYDPASSSDGLHTTWTSSHTYRNNCKDWLPTAKAYPYEFRKILQKISSSISDDLTIDQICEKYATGNRYGIWTIVDFQKTDEGFIIEEENVAFLSGYCITALWDVVEGKAVYKKFLRSMRF